MNEVIDTGRAAPNTTPRAEVAAPSLHRGIPTLPERPRVHPIAGHINRSYSGGRQEFMRACQHQTLTLTISAENPLADDLQANLVSTLNSHDGDIWTEIPFVRTDANTLTCSVTPRRPGLHSFRAEFSVDNGVTFLRDTIPDSWVLIDPPQVDGLRLYTLLPPVTGTIADWTSDLDRIHDMGFNAVHLLPITARDTSLSPYSAYDLFSIDSAYLTGNGSDGLTQLEPFLTRARELGVRLCFDLVLNHVGVNSAIVRRAPDWIVPDQAEPDGLRRPRYWAGNDWHTWDDLVLIDYEHPSEAIRAEIWAYMTDYALFWARFAAETGGFVRLDNLHGSDPKFMDSVTAALRTAYPVAARLAEYFTDETTLVRTTSQWELNLTMATPWGYKFVPQLREYLVYLHRISGQVRHFMPITSHDSGTPAEEFGSVESTVPRYVAAALLGTGATGMPQGVEYAAVKKIEFIGVQAPTPHPAEARFAPFLRRVNQILAEYLAFHHGGNCHFIDNGHSAIIAAFRPDTAPGSGFLVACNFDGQNRQRVSVDLAPFLTGDGPYSCAELLSGESRVYPTPRFELDLPPNSAQVLRLADAAP